MIPIASLVQSQKHKGADRNAARREKREYCTRGGMQHLLTGAFDNKTIDALQPGSSVAHITTIVLQAMFVREDSGHAAWSVYFNAQCTSTRTSSLFLVN